MHHALHVLNTPGGGGAVTIKNLRWRRQGIVGCGAVAHSSNLLLGGIFVSTWLLRCWLFSLVYVARITLGISWHGRIPGIELPCMVNLLGMNPCTRIVSVLQESGTCGERTFDIAYAYILQCSEKVISCSRISRRPLNSKQSSDFRFRNENVYNRVSRYFVISS